MLYCFRESFLVPKCILRLLNNDFSLSLCNGFPFVNWLIALLFNCWLLFISINKSLPLFRILQISRSTPKIVWGGHISICYQHTKVVKLMFCLILSCITEHMFILFPWIPVTPKIFEGYQNLQLDNIWKAWLAGCACLSHMLQCVSAEASSYISMYTRLQVMDITVLAEVGRSPDCNMHHIVWFSRVLSARRSQTAWYIFPVWQTTNLWWGYC